MPKSDLTYRTNTDEADTKTNDTSDVIENITQKVKSAPREEGQDVRDYIQKQGTHTGLIGAVVGTIMAAASSRNNRQKSLMESADAGRYRKSLKQRITKKNKYCS